MQYTMLGKTGLKVSRLGFGAMRLPMIGQGADARVDREKSTQMIHAAFERGVNYIDSAVFYCNADSQRAVGDALKGWRDKVIVSTKNHYLGEHEEDWWELLEDSLKFLQVDYLDIYNHHGVNEDSFFNQVLPRVSKWMEKARDQGLVRHICISFHDNNAALKKIIETGYPEVITLQYNLLDRQLEESIALAHEKGIGIVAMGPVGGGRLGAPNEVLSGVAPGIARVPELALRFVLANPHIDVALSGMSEMRHVTENLDTSEDPVPLNAGHREAIRQHLERLKRMADLYCTGCNYCMPCPHGVNIPHIFALYNQAKVYGLWEHSRAVYGQLLKDQQENNLASTACTECGQCMSKCPQHIAVIKQLKEAHEALAPAV